MNDFSSENVEQLRAAVTELSTLNEIATAINSTMSVDVITSIILDKCIKHTGSDQGAIFLINDEHSNTFNTFIRCQSELDTSTPFHLNMSIVGWMLLHKKIVHIDADREDKNFPGMKLDAAGVSSLVAAPLLNQDDLIGVLALFKKSKGSFANSATRFIEIVCSQCSQVLENARLHEEEESLHIIRKDLEVARQIQQKMLPDMDKLSFSETIYGINVPAHEVGGDLFDIEVLDEDNIFISIADVSGKGVSASLLMSNAQASLRTQLNSYPEVNFTTMVANLNRLIYQFTPPEKFITGIFGIYNISSRTFKYVNAGHPPPIVWAPAETNERNKLGDIFLGYDPDTQYQEQQLVLPPGAILVLITDGVIDALLEGDDDYCERWVREFATANKTLPIKEFSRKLMEELTAFRGDAPQPDDITFVVVTG